MSNRSNITSKNLSIIVIGCAIVRIVKIASNTALMITTDYKSSGIRGYSSSSFDSVEKIEMKKTIRKIMAMQFVLIEYLLIN